MDLFSYVFGRAQRSAGARISAVGFGAMRVSGTRTEWKGELQFSTRGKTIRARGAYGRRTPQLSFQAGSIPLVALTAWQALVERAGLKKGQKVLIYAGSGGVGTIAIQLAKRLGATVATTASTANLDLVKSLAQTSRLTTRRPIS